MLCLRRRNRSSHKEPVNSDGKMLVSEGSILSEQQQNVIRVVVVAATDGSEWAVNVDPDFTVDKLKLMSLSHFYNPSETVKVSSAYRLISVTTERQLNDDFTLQQELVNNNDELLLVRKKSSGHGVTETQEVRDILSKGPDEATIRQLTVQVPVKNANRVAEDSVTVVDFQVELRKTLVSLIEAAQKIQLYNKNNLSAFISLPQDVNSSVSTDSVNPSALKQLTDMGFAVEKSRNALMQKNMCAVDALEYLLVHGQSDTEEEIDTGECQSRAKSESECQIQKCLTSSGECNGDMPSCSTDSSKETSGGSSSRSSPKMSETISVPQLIPLRQLLEAFRAYKRRDFRPNMKAFRNLQEMGFDQEKIVDALRVSGNNHDAAFEWLLSHWLTDDDLKRGLDPEGSVYKAIIANPVIQIGLNSPKVLYAFLHMLENPNCANHWLNDPDLAPLLNQIFKIYHLEKYSLQIRQSSHHINS